MTSGFHDVLRQRLDELKSEELALLAERDNVNASLQVVAEQKGHLEALVSSTNGVSSPAVARFIHAWNLGNFSPNVGDSVPPFMQWPNGTKRALRSWKDLLLQVVESLVESGKLTQKSCPIAQPRATKRYLVAASPTHMDGSSFREPVQQSPGIWVETHAGAPMLTGQAQFLLHYFREDPSLFQLPNS